jgi:DNA-binding response OmpR family regulator
MPKKILVVDDDAKVVELVRLYLEKNHFQVLVAHDGLQAVDTARRRIDRGDLTCNSACKPACSWCS